MRTLGRKGVGACGRLAVAAVVCSLVLGAPAAPASADLLGGLLCPVTNTLGVTSAGWDDGATTPPTTLAQVRQVIGASSLAAKGVDGTGVDVALIDSGVVPVLGLSGVGKVITGPDLSFDAQTGAPSHLDTFGHGTHLAGIVAGDDGASGFDGVAPGARLISLKVAAHDGAADVSQVLAAIDWVVQHRNDPGMNIRVLALAYGTASTQGYRTDPLAFAVENAWRHGIVTVVAGGNDGRSRSTLVDPAIDPYVLAVGAADITGSNLLGCASVAPFSSRSTSRSVDVIAPGVSIQSLRNPGSSIDDAHPGAVVSSRYFRGSGTSQAAAVTAGAVALLLDARPILTPDQVKALLKSTASPLSLLDAAAEGSGMINVATAAKASVSSSTVQSFARAAGTGLLEPARGGDHVAMDGIELVGEQDVLGRPWNGTTWAAASAAARAWTGGAWNGAEWTGTCFCTDGTAPWTGKSWTGKSWSGQSWTGKSWSGQSWTGKSWSGQSWTGQSWTGKSWSGQSWTGKSWTSPASP